MWYLLPLIVELLQLLFLKILLNTHSFCKITIITNNDAYNTYSYYY